MGTIGTFLRRRGRDKYSAALAKGVAAETKVVVSLRRRSRPWWIDEVRFANLDEDRGGIDVVVRTPCGPLFLQVKSSSCGRRHWLEAHASDERPIAAIIVGATDDLNTVYGRALGALILLRERQEATRDRPRSLARSTTP